MKQLVESHAYPTARIQLAAFSAAVKKLVAGRLTIGDCGRKDEPAGCRTPAWAPIPHHFDVIDELRSSLTHGAHAYAVTQKQTIMLFNQLLSLER